MNWTDYWLHAELQCAFTLIILKYSRITSLEKSYCLFFKQKFQNSTSGVERAAGEITNNHGCQSMAQEQKLKLPLSRQTIIMEE